MIVRYTKPNNLIVKKRALYYLALGLFDSSLDNKQLVKLVLKNYSKKLYTDSTIKMLRKYPAYILEKEYYRYRGYGTWFDDYLYFLGFLGIKEIKPLIDTIIKRKNITREFKDELFYYENYIS